MITITRRMLLSLGARAVATSGRAGAAEGPVATADPTVPRSAAAGVRTGGSRSIRVDGKYDVWVKEVGSGPIPVLTLHGGPGFSHFYLECLEDFLPQAGVRLWHYDQLGCGFSDAPKDASLWTIERYCSEVEQVRSALGLEQFILYGHSWGAMLGIEYALRHPTRLSGLVISNMAASVQECVAYATTLLDALPETVRTQIASYRARGAYGDPAYQDLLLREVYRRHFCRLDPWPEPVLRTMRFVNQDIYNAMSGPDEFDVTGLLKTWDVRDRLHALTMPTLLIAAAFDEMPPQRIVAMASAMPRARAAVCERGSHMAMYDDQETYFKILVSFLRDVHEGTFRTPRPS